jgi:hypothetical protein
MFYVALCVFCAEGYIAHAANCSIWNLNKQLLVGVTYKTSLKTKQKRC